MRRSRYMMLMDILTFCKYPAIITTIALTTRINIGVIKPILKFAIEKEWIQQILTFPKVRRKAKNYSNPSKYKYQLTKDGGVFLKNHEAFITEIKAIETALDKSADKEG